MNDDCIFCKIANNIIETEIVYQDGEITAFKDNNPQAPVHVLFISNKHIETLNDVSADDGALLGDMLIKIKRFAEEKGISEDGYRLVINCMCIFWAEENLHGRRDDLRITRREDEGKSRKKEISQSKR